MKKLVFDTTDANTILDSDSVGAFLRASDGTLLTHTDVGGKKALDVRVAEGINVEVDLSHVDDSVQIGDGTDLMAVNADGSINVVASATDLDIRDLSASQDNVAISDGTDTLAINADGSLNITDNGGSLTVDATDLDIRDLTHASDSVKIGDGTDFLAIEADGSINVNVASIQDAALANTAIAHAVNALDVASTAEDVVASPLANRKYLFIHNEGNRTIFIGASGVTEATGFPLYPEQQMMLRAGAAVDIEWVGPNTSQSIRTLELS